MILHIEHAHSEQQLELIGITDWQMNAAMNLAQSGITVFMASHKEHIPSELQLEDWRPTSGSDSEAYTDATQTESQYLCETIEHHTHQPDTMVWVIPTQKYPVLNNTDVFGEYYPTKNQVEKLLE